MSWVEIKTAYNLEDLPGKVPLYQCISGTFFVCGGEMKNWQILVLAWAACTLKLEGYKNWQILTVYHNEG